MRGASLALGGVLLACAGVMGYTRRTQDRGFSLGLRIVREAAP